MRDNSIRFMLIALVKVIYSQLALILQSISEYESIGQDFEVPRIVHFLNMKHQRDSGKSDRFQERNNV